MPQLVQYQALARPLSQAGETITQDKWGQPQQTPQAAFQKAARFSLAAIAPAVFFVSTFTQETIKQDKWQQPASQPRMDVERQQHTYPSFFTDSLDRNEVVSLDRWQQPQNLPRFDQRRHQFLYPPFSQDTRALTQPEAVSLDKWLQDTWRPDAVWKRNSRLSTAAIAPYFFYVHQGNNDGGTGTTQASQNVVIISFPHVVQYQGKAEPLREIAAPEVVTVDKWWRETSTPRFDVRRWQWTYPSAFFHPEPQEVTQFIPLEGLTKEPDFLWDIPRRQWSYPSLFLHEEPKEVSEFTGVEGWYSEPQQVPASPAPRRPHLSPSFTTDPRALTDGERVSVEKWFQEASRPRFDLRRQQQTFPSFFPDSEPREVSEFVTADSWHHEAPVILIPPRAKPHLYPSFFTDARSLTTSEAVSLDRFQQPQSTPRWDIRRQQHLSPSFTADTTTPAAAGFAQLDTYFRETERPPADRKRWQFTYPTFFIDGVPRSETITLEKWFKETEKPIFDRKRQQHVLKSFFPENEPREISEFVTADQWYQEPPQVWDRARTQFLHQSLFLHEEPKEAAEFITADAWHQEPSVILLPRKAQPHLWPSLFFDPQQRGVTIDQWLVAPAIPASRPSTIHLLSPGALVKDFVAAPVTLDQWYRQLQEPVRTVAPRPPGDIVELIQQGPVDLGWFFEDSAVILLRRQPLNAGIQTYWTTFVRIAPPPRSGQKVSIEDFLPVRPRAWLSDPMPGDEPTELSRGMSWGNPF